MARQRIAKVVTEAKERNARIEKVIAWRRRTGSCARVLVEGGRDLAARRVESNTCAVRPVTRIIWPPKRANGSELLRVEASESTGAIMKCEINCDAQGQEYVHSARQRQRWERTD